MAEKTCMQQLAEAATQQLRRDRLAVSYAEHIRDGTDRVVGKDPATGATREVEVPSGAGARAVASAIFCAFRGGPTG